MLKLYRLAYCVTLLFPLLYFTPVAYSQITLRAVGDVMLGSYTPRTILPPQDGKFFADSIGRYLKGADIVFGNLEGAFIKADMKPQKCTESSRRAGRCYEFGMPPTLAPVLQQMGFTVMSMDNNHVSDYGDAAYHYSKTLLAEQGIAFAPKKGVAEVTIRNKKIAIVAFGFSETSYQVSNPKYAAQVIDSVKKNYDLVIVSFHGGAEGKNAQHVENKTEMFYGENRGNLIEFAHSVIDAGATMVIGHGPHVLRALELYKNKLIMYSLGNFLTYGNMNIQGITGVGAIVEAEIDEQSGDFRRGKIIPTRQLDPGYPVHDAEKLAITVMKSLTETDFPNTPLTITDDGTLSAKLTK
jgi:poly-gamma-glutamate capsule biosynthesis protein CapA/YwtB (metallophosphatase superfamily)